MSTDPPAFDQWCILEIMGHQRFAGRVSEITIAGFGMLRLDVPQTPSQPAFTRIFIGASVYAISPVTEETARLLAAKLGQSPISLYDMPYEIQDLLRRAKSLPAPTPVDDQDHAQDYDDDEDCET